jgi:hypothetical protein
MDVLLAVIPRDHSRLISLTVHLPEQIAELPLQPAGVEASDQVEQAALHREQTAGVLTLVSDIRIAPDSSDVG